MEYEITYERLFEKGLEKHKKIGDKTVLIKIDTLLNELRKHPKIGSGKVEQLKHNRVGQWSRRITGGHRLIYTIDDEKLEVVEISCYGHYEDR